MAEVQKDLQPDWSFRDKIVFTDGIVMKGKRIIVPGSLQNKALSQLHLTHMGIKTHLLMHESVFWVNMYTGIKRMIKTAPHVLISKQNPRTKQCHIRHQAGYGNLVGLTSFQLIASTIYVM